MGVRPDMRLKPVVEEGDWAEAREDLEQMASHSGSERRRRVRLAAGRCLLAAVSVMVLPAQGTTSGSPAPAGWLLNKGNLILPGDLPRPLATAVEQSGNRMMSADKALITLTGTVTDSHGSRAAQISIQAPGYLVYREGQSRAVAFNDSGVQSSAGAATPDDDAVMESMLAHFPDTVCLQVATGGSLRRIGSHFRADNSRGGTYTGPYWTLLAFSPSKRQGLAAGKALQQELFIAIDEKTGFIAEVKTAVNSSPTQRKVNQTQFSNWIQQGDQWFPGKITRLENGIQVLSFQMQQAAVGVAGPTTAFRP